MSQKEVWRRLDAIDRANEIQAARTNTVDDRVKKLERVWMEQPEVDQLCERVEKLETETPFGPSLQQRLTEIDGRVGKLAYLLEARIVKLEKGYSVTELVDRLDTMEGRIRPLEAIVGSPRMEQLKTYYGPADIVAKTMKELNDQLAGEPRKQELLRATQGAVTEVLELAAAQAEVKRAAMEWWRLGRPYLGEQELASACERLSELEEKLSKPIPSTTKTIRENASPEEVMVMSGWWRTPEGQWTHEKLEEENRSRKTFVEAVKIQDIWDRRAQREAGQSSPKEAPQTRTKAKKRGKLVWPSELSLSEAKKRAPRKRGKGRGKERS